MLLSLKELVYDVTLGMMVYLFVQLALVFAAGSWSDYIGIINMLPTTGYQEHLAVM